MAELQFDVNADDNASAAFLAVAAAAEAANKELDRLDGRRARVRVQITGATTADLNRVRQVETALSGIDGRTARARVEITGTPDAAQVRQLRAAAKALRELDGLTATTSVQFTGNLPDPRELRAAARALRQLQDASPVTVRINVTGITTELAAIIALGRALLKVGAAGGAAAVGTINAAAAVASLAGSLASLAGLAPVAVAGMVAGGAAAATLAVGLHGVADALKETDPTKFAEALEGLAPAAQEFARAVREIGPAWKSVQLDVQQRLFAGLAEQLQRLSSTYLPGVRVGLGQIADGFNGIAKDLVAFATSADTVRDVDQIFARTAAAVQAARPSVVNLAAAFRDVAAVGTDMLPELANGWSQATATFRDFIAEARQTGRLAEWIGEGVDTLKQLGSIAGNVGSALGSIFRAAEAAGADFLTTLDRVTESVAELLGSARGQNALLAMFTEARAVVDRLEPGVRALAEAALDMVSAFTNTGGLRDAAQALSDLGTAVAPLLPALGELAGNTLSGLGSALSGVASALTPVVTAITGFLTAIGPVGPAVLAAVVGFKALSLAMVGVAALGVRAAAAGAAITASFGLSFVPGATAAAAALTGIGVALRFVATAVPILGAVTLAIALLAGGHDDAAAAARRQQGAIDGLKGTLNQLTGAATDATVAMQAQDIAGRKLADGTTSFATAISQAGLDLREYTQAASGNEQALRSVNAQLVASAKTLPELQGLYQQWKPQLDRAGISLDTFTAAAIGNDAAMKQVTESSLKYQRGAIGLADEMRAAAGTVGELGAALGQYSGTVAEAQEQTRVAAAAVKDFGSTLDTIKVGLGGLAEGAAQTDVLQAGFRDLATAAAMAATKAGEAAEKIGGVEAGAAAASSAMQESRDAFIAAAEGADLTTAQASALATQIGLIPAAARTNFETNATGVAAELNVLAAQVAAVPDAKQITVQALSDAAKAKLVDLGFTVTNLPNGQVQVDVHDEAGRAKLATFLGFVNTSIGRAILDADPARAVAQLNALLAQAGASTGVISIDGNPTLANGKITQAVTFADGSRGTITIDGNQEPANGKITATVRFADGSTGTIQVNANAGAANSAINDAARDRTSTINVRYNYVNRPGDFGSRPGIAGGGVIGYARGGIVAQSAPRAGSWCPATNPAATPSPRSCPAVRQYSCRSSCGCWGRGGSSPPTAQPRVAVPRRRSAVSPG
ncbi:MAG: hypothetical protein L0H84_12065 [Pseudonocardia sp.]|nr:hypothetical protein [Pseudonocardia sp.]